MTNTSKQPEYDRDTDPIISLKDVFTVLRFLVNAIFRHKVIVIVSIILITAATVSVAKVLPRSWVVTARIMTHGSKKISALAQTGTQFSGGSTTYGVEEIMKSRENLLAIVDEANLVELWGQQRKGISKFKDDFFATVFGKPTKDDIRESLVYILGSHLGVFVDGNMVNIRVEWQHPQTAFELQQIVLNRFFEERRSLEMGEIKETIRLLEEKQKEARDEVQRIADENEKLISKSEESSEVGGDQSPQNTTVVHRGSTASKQKISSKVIEEISLVSEELDSTQSEIKRLRAEHARKLAAEKQNLAEIEAQYGPQHPDMIRSKRYVELLSEQNPVPVGLQEKRRSLEALLDRLENSAMEGSDGVIVRHRFARRSVVPQSSTSDDSGRDALAALVKSQLTSREYQNAQTDLNRIEQKLANARMEREATEAAFAYRYRVTQPPLFPRQPSKPQVLKIMIGGFLLSIFLGFFFAIFADIRSGVIIESWQVEKILDVPLLGEVEKS